MHLRYIKEQPTDREGSLGLQRFSMPQGFGGGSSNRSAWIQVGICILILIAALGAVLLVKKHNE